MLEKFKKQLSEKKEIYLRIKAFPGSSKNEIKEIMADGVLKIAVKALPEKGKANKELINFIAEEFMIKKENVIIVSGVGDRLKLIRINL